ncbi:hypothetical protein V2G26_020335 [Clonostachys chloroleuca]
MRPGGIAGVDDGSWISCQKAVCDENDRSDHCQLAELESCIGREPSMAVSCSLPPQPLLRRFEKGENARILWKSMPALAAADSRNTSSKPSAISHVQVYEMACIV